MNDTNSSEGYDYFSDPADRFPTEYESGYDNTTVSAATLAPTNTADVVAQSLFDSPLAFWASFLLAVVAALAMSLIIYKSNKRAVRERYARAQNKDSEFEIRLSDIERDDATEHVDMFSDPPEDAPLSQSQLEHFGI